jgi:hypothetical protein
MTDQQHACSQRVYSGARWDFGGHLCKIAAKRQDEQGRWWCTRHHPDAKGAKKAEQEERYKSQAEAKRHAHARITAALEELRIVGWPQTGMGARFGEAPTGAFISVEQLEALADRLMIHD